jgi:BlaI family penicillinase repressor
MKELTKAEDQIMQILWEIRKGFVKDVIAEMPDPKPAYNTVSTIIRILENKGFVNHKSYGKTHEYYPIVDRDTYRSFFLRNLLRNYFGGKFEQLVSFFAKDNDLDINDMEEILKNVESDLKDPEK